jgi:hypothetical protein
MMEEAAAEKTGMMHPKKLNMRPENNENPFNT